MQFEVQTIVGACLASPEAILLGVTKDLLDLVAGLGEPVDSDAEHGGQFVIQQTSQPANLGVVKMKLDIDQQYTALVSKIATVSKYQTYFQI